MIYKCCKKLMGDLVFASADVMACCCSPNNKFIKFYKQADCEIFNLKKYIEVRNEYINKFKNNIIPEECQSCHQIEELDWDENIKINNIIISNRTKCSCNCFYCSLLEGNDTIEKKKELNTRKPYPIKQILKELKESDLINNHCAIQIAGGDPIEYPDNEFEWLLDFSINLNARIEVLSSGLFFSKYLEDKLSKYNIKLIISPDSGTKKTYEKIKRVKAYNQVWNNLKKYIKASNKKNAISSVAVKYIIIPDVNDNLKELCQFLKKCNSIKAKNIIFSVEYNWFNNNSEKPLPYNLKIFLAFIKNLLNEKKFNINFESQQDFWFNHKFVSAE